MILSRTVSATREPTLTDPANSMQAAISIACLSVRDRDETDEANEFATSLAPTQVSQCWWKRVWNSVPMFQASRKANIVVTAKI